MRFFVLSQPRLFVVQLANMREVVATAHSQADVVLVVDIAAFILHIVAHMWLADTNY